MSRSAGFAFVLAVAALLLAPPMGMGAPPASPAARPTSAADPTPPVARPTPAAGLQISVSDALRLALKDQPDVKIAFSRVRVARLKIQEAYIPMQPTVNVTGRYVRDLAPPATTGTSSSDFLSGLLGLPLVQGPAPIVDTYQGVFSLRQTVYTFGRVQWTAAAARLARKQAGQELRTAIEILLKDVQARYVEAQLAGQRIRIAQERLEERRRFLDTSEKLYRAGEVALYDVLQYRTSVREAERTLMEARNEQAQAVATLVVLINLPPGSRVMLSEPQAPLPPPPTLEEGLAAAEARRPELAALRWAVQAAEANVKAVARVNAPTVGIESDATMNNVSSHRWNAGVVVSIPVTDGGQAHNQRQQAEEALYQTRESLEKSRRSAVLEVTRAFEALQSLWPQIAVAEANVDDARQAMSIAEVRYREVMSSSVELLNAQDAFISARDALAGIRARYRLARIDWERATSSAYPVELPTGLQEAWDDAGPEGAPTPPPPKTPTPGPTPRPRTTSNPDATPKPRTTSNPDATPTPRTTSTPDPTPTPRTTSTPGPTPKPRTTSTPGPTPKPRTTSNPNPAWRPLPGPASREGGERP